MEKTLVIAEKPDMGRHIAAVIEPKARNKKTHLEGDRFIITWAIGHLVGLAEPERYDMKYKKWNFAHLPIIPHSFQLNPLFRTKNQLDTIADLARKCHMIINACDAGREGQLIFSYIQKYLRLHHPVKRLWISDLTEETIRKGFHELKDENEYKYLTSAAIARSEADWLIGMNGSRAFSSKHRMLLSVGRVQTPVLALIYDRMKEIEAFISTEYFQLFADFVGGATVYRGLWQGPRIVERSQAECIANKVNGKNGIITNREEKETKEWPLKLYDLTLLQREANAKYGFSAKKTLDLAQALYEKHKVITYPRTNSNYVNIETIPFMHKALDALRGTQYDQYLEKASKSRVHQQNKSVCNPAKVEDHHAILPTNKKAGKLSVDEQKVYDLIVRRFLSYFYPPARYLMHTVLTMIENETFKTTGKEVLELGWKVLYEGQTVSNSVQDEENIQEWKSPFSLDERASVECRETLIKKLETKPPKLFTEGTLLKEMENAGKRIGDEDLREVMKDSGLGTPATRAGIIERLKKVGYIELRGRSIAISTKGAAAIELVRGAGIDLLTSPEMTGLWEKRLSEIAKGQAEIGPFMESVKKFTRKIVDHVSKQSAIPQIQTLADHFKQSDLPGCPNEGCKGKIVKGKKGFGCSEYKGGCRFFLWKTFMGKTLTESMVKNIILKNCTGKLKFKDKQGNPFSAKIILVDRNTGKLGLERMDE
ncbi:MAG TPA: DNA topoisomerase 3 [Bacillota bacterium]|nr:DNA topoisomerase 3 [Bacillota bacterium]